MKKHFKNDRLQKIVDFHVKVRADLRDVTAGLKKNYKLHRARFYEVSEFRDYVVCLYMSKEKARYFFDLIQATKNKIRAPAAKRELEEIEASEDSSKALTKKEGAP